VDSLNWAKVILMTLVMQVVFVPILWRHFIPLKKLALNILRIASFILLGPVYLFLAVMLHPTSAEGTMLAVLSGLGVGIQGIFLAIQYKRKKTIKKGIAFPNMAKVIGYALAVLILALLGLYFVVYQRSFIIGSIFCTLAICAGIFIIVKIEKFLDEFHKEVKDKRV
jgi:hypothetical protein